MAKTGLPIVFIYLGRPLYPFLFVCLFFEEEEEEKSCVVLPASAVLLHKL